MITEDGKVEFNDTEQAEINRIISERLGREGIQDMKEIMESLKPFGYEGTPAEIKAAIKRDADDFVKQLDETQKQETLDALKNQAKETGTTPELLATIKALVADMSEIKGERKAVKDAETQKTAAEKLFDSQIKYFEESDETKGIELAKLNENPKFIKFLNKQRPTGKLDFLVEVYKDFVELVGGAEAEAIAKIQANLNRSSSAGKGKGDSSGTYGLSPEQVSTVDDWNKRNPHMKMSYKEFAERK